MSNSLQYFHHPEHRSHSLAFQVIKFRTSHSNINFGTKLMVCMSWQVELIIFCINSEIIHICSKLLKALFLDLLVILKTQPWFTCYRTCSQNWFTATLYFNTDFIKLEVGCWLNILVYYSLIHRTATELGSNWKNCMLGQNSKQFISYSEKLSNFQLSGTKLRNIQKSCKEALCFPPFRGWTLEKFRNHLWGNLDGLISSMALLTSCKYFYTIWCSTLLFSTCIYCT